MENGTTSRCWRCGAKLEQRDYGFLPRIDNRLRELRSIGWVESRKEEDGLLHWYPTEGEN